MFRTLNCQIRNHKLLNKGIEVMANPMLENEKMSLPGLDRSPCIDLPVDKQVSISNQLNEFSKIDNICAIEDFGRFHDDLYGQIVEKVEYHFSDANIARNKFLQKHLKGNKNGFMSLKLITGFKDIKSITKDWRLVGEAIERKSKILRLNDLKTKVFRLVELPEFQKFTIDSSQSIISFNLPSERPTIEDVRSIFSVYGHITFIRILRPGNPIPVDIKKFIDIHPNIKSKVCSLIEYEEREFALKAVNDFNKLEPDLAIEILKNDTVETNHNDVLGQCKMKVMELEARPLCETKNQKVASTAKFSTLSQNDERRNYSRMI